MRYLVFVFFLLIHGISYAALLNNGKICQGISFDDNWYRAMVNTVNFTSGNFAESSEQNANTASVIDFQNDYGITGGWPTGGGGYRYWMSATSVEPEWIGLFVSNDGIHWRGAPTHATQSSPPNTNMIWPWANTPNDGNSDPAVFWGIDDYCVDGGDGYIPEGQDADSHILYDPTSDQLLIYWARERTLTSGLGDQGCGIFFNFDSKAGIYRATISNTYLSSNPVKVLDSPFNCGTYGVDTLGACNTQLISPVVIREDDSNWHIYMWQDGNSFYNYGNRTDRESTIVYSYSTDGINWEKIQDTNIARRSGWMYTNYDYMVWHLSAKLNPFNSSKALIMMSGHPTFRWLNQGFAGMGLILGEIDLSSPATINDITGVNPVLEPVYSYTDWAYYLAKHNNIGTGIWDALGIYHGSFSIASGGAMTVWYTGFEDISPVSSKPVIYDYGATSNIGYATGVLFSLTTDYDDESISVPSTEAPTTNYAYPSDPVLLENTQATYSTIQGAYDSVPTKPDETVAIKVKGGEQSPGDIMCDRNMKIRIEGGHDDTFSGAFTSNTEYFGTLTINDGTVTISNLIIK